MGGPGSGRKKLPKRQVRDAIQAINVDGIFQQLEEWAKGKRVICPSCGADTGSYTADTVALQSAIELLNRRLGKPVQQVTLDITETIQLNADQIDHLLVSRFGITIEDIRQFLAQRALAPVIEGEVKLIDS